MKILSKLFFSVVFLTSCGAEEPSTSSTKQFVQYDQACIARVSEQLRQEQAACYARDNIFENCIPTQEYIQYRLSVCIVRGF